jgi:hypothetical protein
VGRTDRLRAAIEAKDALPKAHCQYCGGIAALGEGRRDPEPEFATFTLKATHEHWLTTLPPNVDGWRRSCDTCSRALADGRIESAAVSAILGVGVTQRDALAVVEAVTTWDMHANTFTGFPTARTTGRVGKKPWEHVTLLSASRSGRLCKSW